MPFNLTNILADLGRNITRELRMKMQQQVGVDGIQYRPLSPKTVIDKARHGFEGTKFLRMIRSKDFQNSAFESSASQSTLTVSISDKPHGRDIKSMQRTVQKHSIDPTSAKSAKQLSKTIPRLKLAIEAAPTQRQIAEWQNYQGSKFFPDTAAEVMNLESVKNVVPVIQRAVMEQAREEIKRAIGV